MTEDDRERCQERDARKRHRGVPPDVVSGEVHRVRDGIHLLGDSPELEEAAELAIEHNLSNVEEALDAGATTADESNDAETKPAE